MHKVNTYHLSILLIGLTLVLVGLIFWGEGGNLFSESQEVDNLAIPVYLESEEAVMVGISTENNQAGDLLRIEKTKFRYVEVTDSCNHNYAGAECVNAYASPSVDGEEVARLRTGMVLKVGGQVESGGEDWYKVTFDNQWLRYPERVDGDWYVRASEVNILYDEGVKTTWENEFGTTTKRIVVDSVNQVLTAYEGDELVMQIPISTGLELSPTPRGTFTVFKKMPSRYMQGPIDSIPGSDYYDLPGVPWNLYFTEQGAVIHGAYWHNSFGGRYSHGCVNLSYHDAKDLYNWATLGTKVVVK